MVGESHRTRLSRRSLLGTASGAAAVALAGCSGADETDSAGPDDESGGDDPKAETEGAEDSQYQSVPAVPASWPRYLTGPSNAGYVGAATEALTDLAVATTTELPRFGDMSYVLADETVLVENGGTIRRYDPTDGQRWERSPTIAFGPMVADGTVYALTDELQLLALEGETGDRRSLEPLPLEGEPTQLGTVAFDEGRLYVLLSTGYGEHAVVAYDVADGSAAWENYVEYGQVTMALGDGVLAVSEGRSLGGAVRAYDPDTGDELWLDEDLEGYPEDLVAQGNVVYALNTQSSGGEFHYAFDAATGRRRWVDTPSSGVAFNRVNPDRFLADGERFYHTVDEGYAAFDAATGEREWTKQLTDLPELGPLVTDDALYLARGNRLSVLDPGSGDELWSGAIERVTRLEYLMLHADRLWATGSDGTTDLLVALQPGSDAS